ncbi:thiamine biosynthesis lipoprotein ApbE precursor [Janthinobacterium sp. HH103]|uniref:FAD:protein FMN transferase n=1 Tax=unclassified Janthinobacterium TaxID=2610881 RepID=UPI000873D818|nr:MULTISPECIES: FAD:protein FMN transferase [unclassified Janthinobacterium]OEZ64738.1 thiamine biosynthesis lipoprotein ApbE precursor [Janthinobacterium sp. HH100]OEZ77071.1 thiamine biosynthesis lipoprotein ApbE precursor [Janthinobacterium sp. HH103]QOU74995.1 FAD:protein FMN transferase [Janthinobacterium sp. HH102]
MRRVLLPQHISDQAAPPGAVIRDLRGLTMGTSWSVRLLESAMPGRAGSADLQQGLQQQLDLVVAQMSHWSDESDLGRFNRAEPGSWHSLPAAFCEVLGFAMHVSQASGGAYDPCAGALVNLWGFGPRHRYDESGFLPPNKETVALLLSQRQRRRLELDLPARRARQPGGLQLDLSAIAKGYGVDRLARYLDSQGIGHYLVEVGGELRGAGSKPDGQPWWVMLEQVDGADADLHPPEMLLALHGLSVATSGDYRRFFEDGTARFSHTIDPRSGMPIANQLASVTVVHEQCMAADAWSTALTVLGVEAGMALAEEQGLAARFLQRDGSGFHETLSSHMLAMLDE